MSILREGWRIYKSKFKVFLGLIIIPAILIIMGTLIPLVGKEPIKAFVIAALLLLIAIFIGLFTILTILFSLKDNLDLKQSYKKSFKKLASFSWVCFLIFCLSIAWIFTGAFASLLIIYVFILYLRPYLYLILIGPYPSVHFPIEGAITIGVGILYIIIGTIFFIKLFPSIYILIFQEKRGIKALLKSRELVTKRFWKTLGKIFTFVLIITIIGFSFNAILVLIGVSLTIIYIINYIFVWLIIPFCLIYGLLIYKNLQEIKALEKIPVKKKEGRYITVSMYIIIGILGLGMGIVSLGGMANIIYRADDEPLYNDQDLWLPKIDIPIQDNAFYILAPYIVHPDDKKLFLKYLPEQERDVLKAIEFREIYFPHEKRELIFDIIEGEEWNQEFVKHFLKENRQVLEDFQRAVQLSYFQNPAFQNPENISLNTPTPSMILLMNISRINAINSIYLFNQGKEEQAFDQAINIIKIGQMLQDNQEGLMSHLVGRAIKKRGLERIRAMIPKTTLSPKILKEYIVQLEPFKLNERGFNNALKMDYISMINIKKEALPNQSSFFWKPNQTRRKFAEFRKAEIKNVPKFCGDMVKIDPLFKDRPPWLKENAIGYMLLEVAIPDSFLLLYNKCKEDFSIIGTQLLLAIRAYQLDTDEIPVSLNNLIPKYISYIDRDPFDGQPIRFSFERRIIYSIGKNLIDEDGAGDDIQFSF